MSKVLLSNQTKIKVNEKPVLEALRQLLKEYGSKRTISILLTDNASIQELNKTYRGKDYPTDVLSFSMGEFDHLPLGDVVISLEYAYQQARVRGVPLEEELVFLAIHGGLHLLGFEDDTESGYQDMIFRMNEIAFKLGYRQNSDWNTQDIIF